MATWHASAASAPPLGGADEPLLTTLCRPEILDNAWRVVARNRGASGVDGVTVSYFGARAEKNLQRLRNDILSGHYTPSPLRYTAIPRIRRGIGENSVFPPWRIALWPRDS